MSCDRCDREPQPGSALCAGCADEIYWTERMAAEDNNDEETR
jgi:hypothetical protein